MICITAVALVGVVNPAVRSSIFRVFRFDSSALVRAEACRATTLLDLEASDVIGVLQERYHVEESDTVRW